jgi:hypothetical protein
MHSPLNPTRHSQVTDELVSDSVMRTYAYGLQRMSENQLAGSTRTPTFYDPAATATQVLTSSAGTVGNTYR